MSNSPGPWKLDTWNSRLLSSENVTILKFDIYKTTLKDAQLIAAAPEMLEALERARSRFVEFRNMRWVPLAFEEDLVGWIEEIDKVLDKAKGQA